MEKAYVVIVCPNCKRAQIAQEAHQTRQCAFCPAIINLQVARVFLRTNSQEEARNFLGEPRRRGLM